MIDTTAREGDTWRYFICCLLRNEDELPLYPIPLLWMSTYNAVVRGPIFDWLRIMFCVRMAYFVRQRTSALEDFPTGDGAPHRRLRLASPMEYPLLQLRKLATSPRRRRLS